MQALVFHVNGQTDSMLILHATYWMEQVETVTYVVCENTTPPQIFTFYYRNLK